MPRHRCTQINGVFSSAWWSINLPSGWSASEEGDSVAFRSLSQRGVLNISATRKPDGCIVDADFSEFIEESKPGCSAPQVVQAQNYFGFTRHCADDDVSLAEWWLARGPVLVYVTYATADTEIGELDGIRQMIESLRIKHI